MMKWIGYFDHIIEYECGASLTWNNFKNGSNIKWLEKLVSDSPVIQFADWASTENASMFLDGLYSDIIKPLNKRDFDFIFHLGDITNRLFFEIDEVLDIIGDYASYGRVTMVLDENEAGKLWSRLYGRSADDISPCFRKHSAREKYRFLFNAMQIDVLLILYSNRAMLLSRHRQFDFGGRSLTNAHFPMYDEDKFNIGYQLGL